MQYYIPFINRHKPFGCYVLWFRLLLAAVCLCSVVYFDERNEGNCRRGIYCTLPIDKESDILRKYSEQYPYTFIHLEG